VRGGKVGEDRRGEEREGEGAVGCGARRPVGAPHW